MCLEKGWQERRIMNGRIRLFVTNEEAGYMSKKFNDYFKQYLNESYKKIALFQLRKGWLKDTDAVMKSFDVTRDVAEQWIAESRKHSEDGL